MLVRVCLETRITGSARSINYLPLKFKVNTILSVSKIEFKFQFQQASAL